MYTINSFDNKGKIPSFTSVASLSSQHVDKLPLINSKIKSSVLDLKNLVERSINYDNFKQAKTFFFNQDKNYYVSKIEFLVEAVQAESSKSKQRMLSVICHSPKGSLNTPSTILVGSPKEVIKQMQDENLVAKVLKSVSEASEYLAEKTYLQ